MKNRERPDIPCPSCLGKGIIPLPEDYWGTLKRLRQMKRPACAEQVHAADPHGMYFLTTRYSNQLARMLGWGIVKLDHKEGKRKFFTTS